jgi:glycosyltransferase involved in cell wall biosynthesis
MIFHVLAIPTYPTRKEISICAFTQKVYKFSKAMTQRGHTVFHYGHPDSEVECTKHFDVISRETYDKVYQKKDWRDFHSQKIKNKAHEEFNSNANTLIKKNKQSDNDFVLAFWGVGHRGACDPLKNFHVVEPSIGYNSAFAPFKVFESYAHLHRMLHKISENEMPSFRDHVIPPGFYLDDFQYSAKKENYLLFLGRMVDAKGISIAQQLSKAAKVPIKFVGPQNLKNTLEKDNPLAEYIHTVSHEERKELLSKAKALIMPTLYAEPCGWSMIEAFASGTPVLSTDWGGLSEYNVHGKTGFACHSLNEFYHAFHSLGMIDPAYCRQYAKDNFNIDLIMKMYENYFQHVIDYINGSGGIIKEKCRFLKK